MTAFLSTGLFIDGFAGGGGASTGIAQAIGREVDIAINHSPTAIAIHKANHPSTEHHLTDIRAIWPRVATRGRPVAGIWMSPDCKEFSKAKGGPVKDRSIRTLADEIPPWLEETQPECAYVENVEEFEDWGPLEQGADGKWRVIIDRKGEDFTKWVRRCRRAGYRVAWRQLRACNYGAPTSRKRLYIVMKRRGLGKIAWPKPTHGAPGSPGVRSGRLLPWRTAAECIDWTLPCPSIFERKRPLKPATLRRIAHGVMRYVVNAAEPFIVPVTHSGDVRTHPVSEPMRTITTANGGELAAVDVTIAPHVTKFRGVAVGSPADAPMPTVTANGTPARDAGATPLGIVGASLVNVANSKTTGRGPNAWAATEPLRTITTSSGHALVGATLVSTDNTNTRATRAFDPQDPLRTITGSGGGYAAVGATLVRTGHGEKDATGKRRGKGDHSLSKPMPTVTSSRDEALATAAIAPLIDRQFGQSKTVSAASPLGATTAGGGGKSAAVTAFLSSFYTSNTNGGRADPRLPLKTALAGGQHHSVVAAHIEQANTGGMLGRSPSKPLTTVTTTGAQQRIVETTMIEQDALPPAMLARAVEVAAFLVKYYATDGENEVAQSQAVDRPLDTITTKARFAVVTVTIDAVTYVIVDIGLRMLKSRELARAQGFPDSYVLDPECWYTTDSGAKKFGRLPIAKQISAIGNSVCPPVARALVLANQPGLAELRRAA